MTLDHSPTAGSLIKPSGAPTPSYYVARATVCALIEAFPKAKHRARLIMALTHVSARLGSEGHIVRIYEREPVAWARARADAGQVLGIALAELELQMLQLENGHTPRDVSAAAAKVIHTPPGDRG